MVRILFIACGSKKPPTRAKAVQLCISNLSSSDLQYACTLKPNAFNILSAKYRVLTLDEVIEPYDIAVNKMPVDEGRAWIKGVIRQLRELHDLDGDHFIILNIVQCRQYLLSPSARYEAQVQESAIGRQIKCL